MNVKRTIPGAPCARTQARRINGAAFGVARMEWQPTPFKDLSGVNSSVRVAGEPSHPTPAFKSR